MPIREFPAVSVRRAGRRTSFKPVPAALTFSFGALTFAVRGSDFSQTLPDFFKRDYGVFGGLSQMVATSVRRTTV